jgi:outer membrane protein TolC
MRILVASAWACAAAALAAPARGDSTELFPVVSGGLTAEQVGTRAAAVSYQAAAVEDLVGAAEARSDQALSAFIPRLTALGRYTRLSDFTEPPLFTPPPGQLVGTAAAPGTINPNPTQAVPFPPITIPVLVDAYVLQATLVVPVSDYLLRIAQAHTAATHAEDAARYDLTAARAKAASDGKIAFYTWLRARGAMSVAEQNLAVAKAHLKDSETQLQVGNVGKAETLRARTAVASAELTLERAKSAVVLTEKQVRIAIHAKQGDRVEAGEGLDKPLPTAPPNASPLVSEAVAQRPELKSIARNADAARSQASSLRGGRFPSLSAFGDAQYSNPNPRRFPPRNEWFPTWAIGAQITWTPNDIATYGAQGAEAEARASALDHQAEAARDQIELETMAAYQAVVEADTAIVTSTKQLESAVESYRVTKDLYASGRVTGTTLTDAETALAQARFDNLDARVQARTARVRLDHATGRDAKAF